MGVSDFLEFLVWYRINFSRVFMFVTKVYRNVLAVAGKVFQFNLRMVTWLF